MAGFDVVSYAASNKYTDETVEGGGALKGKNCVVETIEKIEGYTRVHFKWTLDDGTVQRQYTDVPDGQKGDRGDRGAIGPQGLQGIQGVQGETGLKGDQGIQGIQGIQGPQGIQGIQGEKGDDGYPFLIYKQYDDISEFNASDFPEVGLMFMVMTWDVDPVTGDEGYPVYRFTNEGNPPYSLVIRMNTQGIKGEKGDKGDTGAQGPQGIQGEQGEKGEKGEKGDTGAQGIQGEQGIGLPDGGTTGQVLVKYSNEDYDFDWKDTTDRVRPNSHALVEAGACYSAIIEAVSSIYEPRGSITVEELVPALLIPENVKNAYNVTDSGLTTEYFIQGAGVTINAGDTVGIINAGPNTILFNLMGNTLDLTDYQTKDLTTPITIGGVSQTTVEDVLGALNDEDGKKVQYTNTQTNDITVDALNITKPTILKGSGASYTGTIPIAEIAYGCFLVIPRNTTKNVLAYGNKFIATITYNGTSWGDWQIVANCVTGATAGDIASLDANGNLVDSGVVASSVIRRVNPSTAVDCNDLIDRFTEYRVGNGDANRPTTDTNAYIIRTFRTGTSSTTYSQIAYQIGGTYTYRRYFNGTTWSPWRKLITETDLIYSSSERDTGATWIDGKPIYRKVIEWDSNLGSVTSKTATTKAHGISNIGAIVKVEGKIYQPGSVYAESIPNYNTNNDYIGRVRVESTNVSISYIGSWTDYRPCVILEYTKTTD